MVIKAAIRDLKAEQLAKANEEKLTAQKEFDLRRLIALKALQEKNELTDITELNKLLAKYPQYENFTSAQLQPELKALLVGVDSAHHIELMIKDYKQKYSKEPFFQEPKTESGKTLFNFPSMEDAKKFFMEQSSKHRAFTIIDLNTNKVMAYSNGDGVMHHGDGKEFHQEDQLINSDVDFKDFSMPESRSGLNHSR